MKSPAEARTCQCCDHEWKSMSALKIHLNAKKYTGEPRLPPCHKRPRPECTLCGKIFPHQQNYRVHLLTKKHQNRVAQDSL